VTLSEPDVALTDFGLAIECACFAAWLHWHAPADAPLRPWFVVFFSAVGLGALLGGITHGFLADQDVVARALWSATLLAIGLAALACWIIGARLLFSERTAKRVAVLAEWLFALYAATILAVSASFAIAVAHYALAGAFLLVAFVPIYLRRRERHLLSGIAGVALSFAAAAVQQTETAIRSLNLSHNALYHLIQAVALLLIFLAARGLVTSANGDHPFVSRAQRST
jgi:uncharacterized protein DUF6962